MIYIESKNSSSISTVNIVVIIICHCISGCSNFPIICARRNIFDLKTPIFSRSNYSISIYRNCSIRNHLFCIIILNNTYNNQDLIL